MKRILILAALIMGLAGCIPQFTSGTLTIAVTGAQQATVTFQPPAGTFDVVLFIGDAQRVLSAAPELTCVPFETGIQCLADTLSAPVAVTVFADPLEDASAQVWWSVPGRVVNIARAAIR